MVVVVAQLEYITLQNDLTILFHTCKQTVEQEEKDI